MLFEAIGQHIRIRSALEMNGTSLVQHKRTFIVGLRNIWVGIVIAIGHPSLRVHEAYPKRSETRRSVYGS